MSTSEILAGVLFCVITFGGLGYFFVTITDDVNQPTTVNTTSPAFESVAPPVSQPVTDEATIVIGSPSITTNLARDQVVVDFFSCIPGSGSMAFSAGTVSFVMSGVQDNDCVVSYSFGEDKVDCRVPASIGVRSFPISGESPDLTAVESYCEAA